MTDLEAKKVAEVLHVEDIWIDDCGIIIVKLTDGTVGPICIYATSINNSVPFRILKNKTIHAGMKHLLDILVKESSNGINCILVETSSNVVKRDNIITKLLNAGDTVESLLVKHDLLHNMNS